MHVLNNFHCGTVAVTALLAAATLTLSTTHGTSNTLIPKLQAGLSYGSPPWLILVENFVPRLHSTPQCQWPDHASPFQDLVFFLNDMHLSTNAHWL